ncbi:MAG: hypothetical protein HY075_10555 [Deltaproteobacteria bacterium]|nr:hypothetical protein [Deltaproteobacteria bacterium]
MNVTWTAIAVLLTFVTPALPLLVIFRFVYPKFKTIAPKDFSLLLLGCLMSVFINWTLIAWAAQQYVSIALSSVDAGDAKWEYALLRAFFLKSNYCTPIRPAFFVLTKCLKMDISRVDIMPLILDLQIRPLFIGLILSGFGQVLIRIERLLLQRADRKDSSESLYAPNRLDRITKLFHGTLTGLRAGFYHPWELLTENNPKHTLLVADVFAKEGSIYSGLFTAWVPGQDGMEAISIQYALRFEPTKLEQKPAPPADPWRASFEKKPASRDGRGKVLVKNNGRLVIPMAEIQTMHFWKIRRGSKYNVEIKSLSDLERLKWYLLLAFTYPDFVTMISINVKLTRGDYAIVGKRLGEWTTESGISLSLDRVKVFEDLKD